jgi:dTDP-6-deoxy-L-talose 4-dehydrogenase (NAD+)
MSGGEQLRDYLPVTEAAGILAQLAIQGCDAGAVNVCAGRPVSVRALVERWIAEHGWSVAPDLGRYPYPDYEPLAFWGDRRRLDAALEIAR